MDQYKRVQRVQRAMSGMYRALDEGADPVVSEAIQELVVALDELHALLDVNLDHAAEARWTAAVDRAVQSGKAKG